MMMRIILSVLLLITLSASGDTSISQSCGYTPKHPFVLEGGANITAPDEYSWTASLQYGNGILGACAGSVISPRYVLTSAQCATDQANGGLTGVRLGDYSHDPFCDYGSSDCQHYQHFNISKIIVHENYYYHLFNDIALLRLDRSIIFTEKLRPICLPFNSPQLAANTSLTVSGWGILPNNNRPKKHAKSVVLWDQKKCAHNEENKYVNTLCTGNKVGEGPCRGDNGAPLMVESETGQMMLEGIVSLGSLCFLEDYPTYYTRVRSFQKWIEQKMREE